MKFEIFNENGVRLFYTEHKECIPTPNELSAMTRLRYKFKVDDKIVSKKKVEEILKK